MALFDIFKKRPASAKATAGKEKEKVVPKKIVKKAAPKGGEPPAKGEARSEERRSEKSGREIKREAVKELAAVPLKPKKDSEAACRILKWPHVTEKATDLAKINQYIFNVDERSNKPEIKKAVQDVYGVKVVSVKIIKIHPKPRRLGRIEGWRKAYKKAIVKLAQGQTIEILPR